MIRAVREHIPDLLPFIHSAYSSPSILLWNDVQVLSAGLRFVDIHQASLLGSPLSSGAMVACLDFQIAQLKLIGERLCHLQTHDAITILRHSFAIPKLLHILQTSPAFSSPLLTSWDNLLMSIVSRITNINFNVGDSSWLQATLLLMLVALGSGVPPILHLRPFWHPLMEPPDSCASFCLSIYHPSHIVNGTLPSQPGRVAYQQRFPFQQVVIVRSLGTSLKWTTFMIHSYSGVMTMWRNPDC